MRSLRSFVAALLLASAAYSQALPQSFAVSDARYAHLARGVNLTRWFQYGSRMPITSADRDLLKQAGFTNVRIAVAPQYLLYRWSAPDRIERNLANLDQAIDLFLSAGMAVTLDLHADGAYLDYYLATPGASESLVVLWHELATRYANRDPELLFFEVMNEPDNRFSRSDWDAVETRALAAIHAAAPRHTVIVDSVNWSGLDALLAQTPYADPNVIYALHYYSPSVFTHQGADWTGQDGIAGLRGVPWPAFVPELQPVIDNAPSLAARTLLGNYRDEDWDANRIDWDMHLAHSWARRWGVRVVVNEFGDYKPFAPADSRARWLRDARVAIEKHGFGWGVWDYAAGFDVTTVKDGVRGIDPDVSAALGLSAWNIPEPVRAVPAPLFSGPRQVQVGALAFKGGSAEAILAIDVNGDRASDIVIAPMEWPELTEHPIQFFLNDGEGVLRPGVFDGPPPQVRASASIVSGRFDRSGRPGFFLPDAGPQDGSGAQSKLMLPAGPDSFRDATGNLPHEIAVTSGAAAGDVDGDGFDDIALFRPTGLQLLRNDGTAHFTPDPEAFPMRASDPEQANHRFYCGVFVSRGTSPIQDLVAFGKDASAARVFRNDGNGRFRNSSLLPVAAVNDGPANGGCAVVADVNGDGYPDVIVGFKQPAANEPDVLQILISNGDGSFRDETAVRGTALPASRSGLRRLAYFNGVLALTRPGEPPVILRLGQDGRFTTVDWHRGASPWIVAPGDLNSDGLVDLIFAPGGSAPLIARFGQKP